MGEIIYFFATSTSEVLWDERVSVFKPDLGRIEEVNPKLNAVV